MPVVAITNCCASNRLFWQSTLTLIVGLLITGRAVLEKFGRVGKGGGPLQKGHAAWRIFPFTECKFATKSKGRDLRAAVFGMTSARAVVAWEHRNKVGAKSCFCGNLLIYSYAAR